MECYLCCFKEWKRSLVADTEWIPGYIVKWKKHSAKKYILYATFCVWKTGIWENMVICCKKKYRQDKSIRRLVTYREGGIGVEVVIGGSDTSLSLPFGIVLTFGTMLIKEKLYLYSHYSWHLVCGFSTLSNSPVLCRHQLSILQFNSILTLAAWS